MVVDGLEDAGVVDGDRLLTGRAAQEEREHDAAEADDREKVEEERRGEEQVVSVTGNYISGSKVTVVIITGNGCNSYVFWLSAFTWDILSFLIPMTCVILLLLV